MCTPPSQQQKKANAHEPCTHTNTQFEEHSSAVSPFPVHPSSLFFGSVCQRLVIGSQPHATQANVVFVVIQSKYNPPQEQSHGQVDRTFFQGNKTATVRRRWWTKGEPVLGQQGNAVNVVAKEGDPFGSFEFHWLRCCVLALFKRYTSRPNRRV